MDNLPDPILSPSKAAQAASLSLAWSEVTYFLTPFFHPHPIPPFERNPATLQALLQLSSHSSAQTDRNALLARTRALALQELQASFLLTTNKDEKDGNNPISHLTSNTDPTLPFLAEIVSSLSPEAHTILHHLSTLPAALRCLDPPNSSTMALSLSHLTRSESETAQQLARVESLHQQLKSEHALAQELLNKLRGESSSTSNSNSASSTPTAAPGAESTFQTPNGLVSKTGGWNRGSKQLGAKLGEYRERARRLEKGNHNHAPTHNHNHSHSHNRNHSHSHGKPPAMGIGLPELRVEERELRDLEARVRGLEGRVRGFEGLPPDKEMALLEVERMRRELEGLVRKRDGMFEGLIERRE